MVEDGTFDGAVLVLNYTYTAWGIWYSKPLFAEQGLDVPEDLGRDDRAVRTIKAAGIAPVDVPGQVPGVHELADAEHGGQDRRHWTCVKAVDNLRAERVEARRVKAAAEAFARARRASGYIMPGSEALSHTESQAAWCQGKAAFIPCGSWLERRAEGRRARPASTW